MAELKNRTLALVGMRGSGKSTVGRAVANALGLSFLDMDHELEKRRGSSIADWVKKEGWDSFRQAEGDLVKELGQNSKALVSTGGGVITLESSVEELKKNYLCIYIHWPTGVLIRRIEGDKKRPALTDANSVKKEVEKLYRDRDPLYRTIAPHVIYNYKDEAFFSTVQKILMLLEDSYSLISNKDIFQNFTPSGRFRPILNNAKNKKS